MKKLILTEILEIFWTTWAISMKFSGKMWLLIILKVKKSQGFTLSLEDTFFGKPHKIKSDEAPFIIYADLECLIKKTDGCINSLESSSITKVSGHIPSGFSMSATLSFKSIENQCIQK